MADRATSRVIRDPGGTKVNVARIVQHFSPTMFAAKVALRLNVLPEPDGRPARVLDAYAGDHDIWDTADEVRPGLEVLHIEQKPTRKTDLSGNNLRYLASMDLSRFDLIDLDAWGQPAAQVSAIVDRGYQGVITWTCITSNMGVPTGEILVADGIDPEWLSVSRKIFDASSLERRWLNFLAVHGWTQAVLVTGRANHLYGAVGYDAWDEARYRDLFAQVRRTGRFARLGVG